MAYVGQPVPSTVVNINAAKVSDGKSVKVTVPQSTTVEAGKFYLLDGFLGCAMQSVITGAGETSEVVLNIEQAEFETDQIKSGDTFAKGVRIYWDDTAKQFTTTAEGNIFAGVVTEPKDANGVIWFILVSPMSVTAAASGTVKGQATFVLPGTAVAGAGKIDEFTFGTTVTVTKVKVAVKTLPGSTAALKLDVNNDGSSLFASGSEPTVSNSDTAGAFKEFTPNANPAKNVFAADSVLSIDIDNAGNTAAADITVVIEYEQLV